MADKRRKDIEAKKRKLAEIRKRRELRREQRGRSVADRTLAPPSERGKEFMNDVRTMVKAMSISKRSLSLDRKEETTHSASMETAGPAYIGNLEVQKKVGSVNIHEEEGKATYEKRIQVDVADLATEIGIIKYNSSENHIAAVKVAFAMSELIVWPPKDKVVEEEVEIKEVEVKEEEIVELAPEKPDLPEIMDAKEALAVMRSEEFQDFWRRSALIMERACAQNEDQNIYVDYGAADNVVAGEQQTMEWLVFKKRYRHEETTVGRPITSLAFSKLHKELFMASYAEPLQPLSDIPDGTVHIWGRLLGDTPEETFQSQSMVTVADFHPSNPKLIVGATVAGAVVVWDMRAKKKTPQNRTPFHTSHQRAVYAMQLVPTHQKVMNIHSVCNRGTLMIWRDDIMESPTQWYDLKPVSESVGNMRGGEELLTTCFSAHPRNPHQIVLGSTDGYIYKGIIYQMASQQRDIEVKSIKAHHGPITSMEFHPGGNRVPKTISDTFLTSSFDWTVKLWDHRTDQEIHCFEHMQDYVHDCKWSPVHPAVFACCDGLGNIHIYDLSKDWGVPLVEYNVKKKSAFALCRLAWSLDGRQLLVGDANGDLLLYEVNQSLYEANDAHIAEFNRYLKHKLN